MIGHAGGACHAAIIGSIELLLLSLGMELLCLCLGGGSCGRAAQQGEGWERLQRHPLAAFCRGGVPTCGGRVWTEA